MWLYNHKKKINDALKDFEAEKELKKLVNDFVRAEIDNPSFLTSSPSKDYRINYIDALIFYINLFDKLTLKDISFEKYQDCKRKISLMKDRTTKAFLNKLTLKIFKYIVHNTTMKSLDNIQKLLRFQELYGIYKSNYEIGTEKERIYFLELIMEGKGDNIIIELLNNFIQQELNSPSCYTKNAKNGLVDYYAAIKTLIKIIRDFNIKDISWKTYCYYQQRFSGFTDSLELRTSYRNKSRQLFLDFFMYIIDSNKCFKLDTINELKIYKDYLFMPERPHSKIIEKSHFMKNLYCNFPIESNPSQLYKVEEKYYVNGSVGNAYFLINLNSDNEFIKKILILFINTFEINKTFKGGNILYRMFFYFFENSLHLLTKKLENIEDFTFDVFKSQYSFYTKIDNDYPISNNRKIVDILKEFYIFLMFYIDKECINHNIFEGTAINIDVLSSIHFYSYYSKMYEFILYSPDETAPSCDKFLLIPNKYTSSNAARRISYAFDFTELKNEAFKDVLKSFVWEYSGENILRKIDAYRYVKEFLNLKNEYDLERKRVINLTEDKNECFTEDFIFTYASIIVGRNESIHTINHIFASVKSFLIYSSEKYSYNKAYNVYFRCMQPDNYQSNSGISPEHFNLIVEEFRKLKHESEIGELLFIILYLKTKTKLRIGEIVNLKRNCIVSVDKDNESGIIQHYTKTEQEIIKTSISLDCINLIERAKELTREYSNKAVNRAFSDFIFIRPFSHHKNNEKYKVITLYGPFKFEFNKIINKLNLPSEYTIYDIRRMRKNQILNKAIEEGHDMLSIVNMIGGSPETNFRSYIDNNNYNVYVELFAGTTVSNVNINGEVIIDDKDLNKSLSNLGCCKENTCNMDKQSGMELLERFPFYKCLMCDNFITTPNRINAFEKHIEDLKYISSVSSSDEERDDCQVLLQLLGAYYNKQLLMIKEKEDDENADIK